MVTPDEHASNEPKQSSFFDAYRQILPVVFRHPATWFLALLALVATVYLLILGKVSLPGILFIVFSIVIVLLTMPLTQGAPKPAWETAAPCSRGRLWLQCGLTLLCIVLLDLLVIFVSLRVPFPLLSPYYTLIRHSPLLLILLGIIFEIVLPLGLVLLLGARWRELGFYKGYHTWRVTALWCVPLILIIIAGVVVGKLAPSSLLTRFIGNLLLAGLPEEIAFRGILLTRLIRLLGTGWGIACTALIFGLVHIGTDITQTGSTSLLIVLAYTIYGQMLGGIWFAILFQRTRSLIPGIISHALTDVASVLFL